MHETRKLHLPMQTWWLPKCWRPVDVSMLFRSAVQKLSLSLVQHRSFAHWVQTVCFVHCASMLKIAAESSAAERAGDVIIHSRSHALVICMKAMPSELSRSCPRIAGMSSSGASAKRGSRPSVARRSRFSALHTRANPWLHGIDVPICVARAPSFQASMSMHSSSRQMCATANGAGVPPGCFGRRNEKR